MIQDNARKISETNVQVGLEDQVNGLEHGSPYRSNSQFGKLYFFLEIIQNVHFYSDFF